MNTITSIVGARPQFIKLAPICRAFLAYSSSCIHRVIHTGQHYDHGMSDIFFDELEIPKPDVDLGVGSGGHGKQTGAMLEQLENEFSENRPSAVIVYGDTNSTLAATLAASKMHIPIMHVEAGLRSFNRNMPEEINRIVADHCADRLYPPTEVGVENLRREALADRAFKTGDVMLDAVRFNMKLASRKSNILETLNLTDTQYGVVTLHRPSNTDSDHLLSVLETLGEISTGSVPLVFPMHPRVRARMGDSLESISSGIQFIDPLGYLDMLRIVGNSSLVLTDSGGLQKEAAMLSVPCITLREETEWTETLAIGANVLVGRSMPKLLEEVNNVLTGTRPTWDDSIEDCYGQGNAAELIVKDVVDWCKKENGSEAVEI